MRWPYHEVHEEFLAVGPRVLFVILVRPLLWDDVERDREGCQLSPANGGQVLA